MHLTAIILSAVAATAIAGPIQSRKQRWKPVDNTTTACDSLGSQYIPIDADATASLVQKVCKKFMPCAEKEVCTQVVERNLNGTQSAVMNDAAVMTKDEASFQDAGWVAQFKVVPAKKSSPSTDADGFAKFDGVNWTPGDCVGYFSQLLSESKPKGCMDAGTGAIAGNLTIGEQDPELEPTNSLNGTVFSLSFVQMSPGPKKEILP